MDIPSPIETIKKRVSCRSFDGRQLESNMKERLLDFFRENTRGPFGNALRFDLIDLTDAERAELKLLGTYGVIRGAGLFIAGTVKRGPRALEDYGYGMERNILFATALGLGTCWLGGTLNRAGFSRKIGLTSDELMPAISPVGYPAEKRSLTDKTIRFMAKSDKRKPWQELFFDERKSNPLGKENAGHLASALESVRIGPSATNRQPWRIIRDGNGKAFHFFLERTPGYEKVTGEIRLQEVDMGIAMCHFELAAKEQEIAGNWQETKPGFDAGTLEYVVSWTADPTPRERKILE